MPPIGPETPEERTARILRIAAELERELGPGEEITDAPTLDD